MEQKGNKSTAISLSITGTNDSKIMLDELSLTHKKTAKIKIKKLDISFVGVINTQHFMS